MFQDEPVGWSWRMQWQHFITQTSSLLYILLSPRDTDNMRA